MPHLSAPLIIFEGPDGSGKTSAAKALAKKMNARYVHHGPYSRMGSGLPRIYLESMLPAIYGHQPVVLDRSWLSEIPYGIAFRDGMDRVGIRRRILERVALRCQTIVVRSKVRWEDVKENY